MGPPLRMAAVWCALTLGAVLLFDLVIGLVLIAALAVAVWVGERMQQAQEPKVVPVLAPVDQPFSVVEALDGEYVVVGASSLHPYFRTEDVEEAHRVAESMSEMRQMVELERERVPRFRMAPSQPLGKLHVRE